MMCQNTEEFNRERFAQHIGLDKENPDEKILDGVIASLTIKNFIFANFRDQLKKNFENENYVSFMEYKIFIYNLIKENSMKETIDELIKKVMLISHEKKITIANVYLTGIILINILIVGFLSHSILSVEVYYHAKNFKIWFMIYVLIFLIWLFYEFQVLMSELEYYEFLGFEIISFHDKK